MFMRRLGFLKEYTAQVNKLDEEHKILHVDVWDNEQLNTFVKRFTLSLTDQTYLELKHLLSQKVFKNKFGDDYRYFYFCLASA
jgi:hypothetical protein